MKFVLLSLIVFTLTPAAATAEVLFGQAGGIVPSGEVAFARTGSSREYTNTTTFELAPEAHYFIIDNLAVGAGLPVSVVLAENTSTVSFGLAPSVAYNISLAEQVSVFPSVGVPVLHTRGFGLDGWRATVSRVAVSVYAPVLWHVAPSFFVGFGPHVWRDVMHKFTTPSNSNEAGKLTSVCLLSILGGCF